MPFVPILPALRRLHADRAIGGDRHHRGADRPGRPRRAEGPRRRGDVQCANNVKQMSPGHGQHGRHQRRPAAPVVRPLPHRRGPGRRRRPNDGDGGIFLFLLPYIEQGPLYQSCYVARGDGNDNRNGLNPTYSQWTPSVQNSSVKTYICPADYTQTAGRPARAGYGVNGQVFPRASGALNHCACPAEPRDGTSNTIFYTDKLAECNSGGNNDNYWPNWGPIISSSDSGDPTGPGLWAAEYARGWSTAPGAVQRRSSSSPHYDGIVTGLADGSVRFVGGRQQPDLVVRPDPERRRGSSAATGSFDRRGYPAGTSPPACQLLRLSRSTRPDFGFLYLLLDDRSIGQLSSIWLGSPPPPSDSVVFPAGLSHGTGRIVRLIPSSSFLQGVLCRCSAFCGVGVASR